MTQQSESIQFDRQKRNLGQKFYTDKNLDFEDQNGLTFSTSSTTPVEVTDSEITKFFEKETSVLILVSGQIYSSFGFFVAVLDLEVDNVLQSPSMRSSSLGEPEIASSFYILDLDPGNHTFKLKLSGNNAFGTYVLNQGSLAVLLLSES